jgi:hypothetical protein
VIFFWMSLPLMQKSSFDTSVPTGNPFKSRSVDLNALDIPSEASAPGYALSGAMTDNPATSGDMADSSLFSSGMGELAGGETAEASVSDGTGASASASADISAPSALPGRTPRPKMSAPGSLSGGNGNSMTAGGVHNKFFGGSNAKAEIAPSKLPEVKKSALSDKKAAGLMAALAAAEKKSVASAGMKVDDSRGGAAGAFHGATAASKTHLDEELENDSAVAGLELGKVDSDLKKNDPSINNKKFKPPEVPEPTLAEKNDEMYKQMIMQMLISQVLGPMFGALMQGAMGMDTPAAAK